MALNEHTNIAAIPSVSNDTKTNIKRKSVLTVGTNPSEKGLSAKMIREAYVKPVIDTEDSAISEIDRVITAINTVITSLNGSLDNITDNSLVDFNLGFADDTLTITFTKKDTNTIIKTINLPIVAKVTELQNKITTGVITAWKAQRDEDGNIIKNTYQTITESDNDDALLRASIGALETNKANKSDIADNLTTDDSNKMLSSKQGFNLKSDVETIKGRVDITESNITNLQTIKADISKIGLRFNQVDGKVFLQYDGVDKCYIDLPTELVLADSGSEVDYENELIKLKLANGQYLTFSIASIVNGLTMAGSEGTFINVSIGNGNTINATLNDGSITFAKLDSSIQGRITTLENAETPRTTAEQGRANAETGRANAETGRVNAENLRASAETSRINAETNRTSAESSRVQAENNRQSVLNNKVDKVSGKGLSTNDYTTEEKNKLDGIESTAQVNVIENVQVDGTDLLITNKKVNIDLSNKANIDGYYAQLGVGQANNLIPEKAAEYTETFDESGETTGGSNTVTDGVMKVLQANGNTDGNGVTSAIDVLGESKVWHQFAKEVNTTNWSGGGLTVLDGVGTFTATYQHQSCFCTVKNDFINNHKYFIRGSIKLTTGTTLVAFKIGNPGYTQGVRYNTINSTEWQNFELILPFISEASSGTNNYIYVQDSRASGWDAISFKNINVIDLSLLYGVGNEPTTVAAFNQDYPSPYYPYDSGSIKSVNVSAINTTGTEQSDQGTITLTTPVELRSVGTIKDELISYDATLGTAKVLRKTGLVNLGTLAFTQHLSVTSLFMASLPNTSLNNNGTNLLSPIYTAVYKTLGNLANMEMRVVDYVLYIKNTTYTDATSFISAMNGQYLVHELATPVVETISVTSTITDKTQILAANLTNSNSDYVQGEVVLKEKLISANIHNLYASGDNQFTGTNWVQGKRISEINGTTEIVNTDNNYCDDFIKVAPNTIYRYLQDVIIERYRVYFYDDNDNFISALYPANVTDTFTTPINCTSIKIATWKSGGSALPTRTYMIIPWSDWTTKTIADWVAPNTQTLALNYVGNKVGTYYDYIDFKLMKNHKVIDKVAFTPELVLSQPNNLYDGDYIYYPKTTEVIEDIPITTPNSIIVRDHGILYFDAPTGEDSATITFLNGYCDDIKKNSVNGYQQLAAFFVAFAAYFGVTVTMNPSGNGWTCVITE